jgi:hypothetical protein
MAGFLLEFAAGDRDQLLVAVGLALRDRPVALVARAEERAARVTEQHLEATVPRPEQEDPGAGPLRHGATIADLRWPCNPDRASARRHARLQPRR